MTFHQRRAKPFLNDKYANAQAHKQCGLFLPFVAFVVHACLLHFLETCRYLSVAETARPETRLLKDAEPYTLAKPIL